MKKGVYFAHSMSDYGTKWEKDKVAFLERTFKKPILNPSDKKYDLGWKREGMKFFDGHFLPKVDVLVFTPFPGGLIGCGVAYEILHYIAAQSQRPDEYLPLYELIRTTDELDQVSLDEVVGRFLGRYLTRAHIEKYKKGRK